jgi:hypothetical protein
MKYSTLIKYTKIIRIRQVTAFWDIAPCSLVEDGGPDDGGSTQLRNVGLLHRNYSALSQKAVTFLLAVSTRNLTE